MLFRSYSHYLKERYGKSVYRVAVDAGFSCPNRKKGRGGEGCTFCDEMGSRAVYQRNDNGSYPESLSFSAYSLTDFPPFWSAENVESQIKRGIAFLKHRYHAELFLLYFQAYSNTDAKPEVLKKVYDHALSQAAFRELIVSTRPDCIDEARADLLASYIRSDFDVWCELGLQTASNRLLEKIQRGHSVEDFINSYQLLKNRGIKIAVHLICDLPTETPSEREETIALLKALKPDGVKLHNLNIACNTPLHREWLQNPFPVADMEKHIETLVYYIRRLPPCTVLMRLTCDTDSPRLILPEKKWNKSLLLQKLEAKMREEKAIQGDLLEKVPSSNF